MPFELLGEHLGTEVGEPPELLEPARCSWQELGGGEGAAEVAAEQPPPEGAVPGAGERGLTVSYTARQLYPYL